MPLAEVGPNADGRTLVVHVDDLGMSTEVNRGGLRAREGAATCGSVMVPCPAFARIVRVGQTEMLAMDDGNE